MNHRNIQPIEMSFKHKTDHRIHFRANDSIAFWIINGWQFNNTQSKVNDFQNYKRRWQNCQVAHGNESVNCVNMRRIWSLCNLITSDFRVSDGAVLVYSENDKQFCWREKKKIKIIIKNAPKSIKISGNCGVQLSIFISSKGNSRWIVDSLNFHFLQR